LRPVGGIALCADPRFRRLDPRLSENRHKLLVLSLTGDDRQMPAAKLAHRLGIGPGNRMLGQIVAEGHLRGVPEPVGVAVRGKRVGSKRQLLRVD